eukprot:SAG11_NODE_615_length_8197_cov_4.551426_10_plen_188_part_00
MFGIFCIFLFCSVYAVLPYHRVRPRRREQPQRELAVRGDAVVLHAVDGARPAVVRPARELRAAALLSALRGRCERARSCARQAGGGGAASAHWAVGTAGSALTSRATFTTSAPRTCRPTTRRELGCRRQRRARAGRRPQPRKRRREDTDAEVGGTESAALYVRAPRARRATRHRRSTAGLPCRCAAA